MDNPLVQVDPGLFIWTILTFLALLGLLKKYAWGPLLNALESRQKMIQKSLDDAEQAKQELEKVQQESAAIVVKARVEANAIISSSRTDAAKLRDELQRQAKVEAEKILKNAERQIQQETERAVSQIHHEAIDLSVSIASKLIQRNLTKEDNEALIEDALKQVQPPQA